MLIYDGDCGFCTTTARWVADRIDDDIPVEPWQALDLDRYQLSELDVTTAAYWVEPSGLTRRGHEAVGRSLQAVGGLWAAAGWLLLRPPLSWLAAPAYALIARYRYRLPGSTDACRLPPR